MKNRYKAFTHEKCEYFPCHDAPDPAEFSCLFCFCPLYPLQNCGGDFIYLQSGVKDCSRCSYPHRPENYDAIIAKLAEMRSD